MTRHSHVSTLKLNPSDDGHSHQQPAVQKVKSEPPASQPTSDTHISKQQPPMYYIYIDSKFIDSKTVKPHWFKDDEWKDGWKNQILPTLCLWASTQINIWSTPKDRVVSGLLLIIPVVFPQLTLYALQLTSAEACVGVVCVLFMLISLLIVCHWHRATNTFVICAMVWALQGLHCI